MNTKFLRVGSLLALLATPVAWAGPSTNEIYRWQAPPAEVQLSADKTVVPGDMGALFVPTLTGVEREPRVLVVDGDQVRRVKVGARAILPPGRYVVLVGSSNPKLAQGVTVEVVAGKTTLVPARWGALRVEVVDSRLRSHPARFELVHVDTGKRVDVAGLESDGGEFSTWLLAPGLYRIVEPGSDKLSGPDFATVHVPSGGVAHFRLFVDRVTGDFRGGGVVPADVALPDEVDDGPWDPTVTVGFDVVASESRGVVGLPDVRLATGSLFVDGRAQYSDRFNSLKLQGQLEEGMQLLDVGGGASIPPIKSRDRLQGSALYTLLLNEGIGLYVGAEAETAILQTQAVATEDTTYAIRELGGAVSYQTLRAGDSLLLAKPWQPTVLSEGAGLRFRFLETRPVQVSVRGGPGLRQYMLDDVLVPDDNARTGAYELSRVSSFNLQGVEAAASITARAGSLLRLTAEGGSFWALGDLDRPILSLDGLATLRLSRVLSFNYLVSVDDVPQIKSQPQLRHGGYLRASWSLL